MLAVVALTDAPVLQPVPAASEADSVFFFDSVTSSVAYHLCLSRGIRPAAECVRSSLFNRLWWMMTTSIFAPAEMYAVPPTCL